ncbi:MAG: cyclic nucleotide-binding domain-containing protein [Calditrichae bacterium]|nr:cyclic nucleotide-binding domain-containing protein [Calditrichia bacterium]
MNQTTIEQLKNIPLFAFVAEDDLRLIAEKLELELYSADTVLIREGEQGDCLYLLKNGRVKVYATSDESGQQIVLSYLENGDHFGEMALISGETRSASIVAVTDVEVWKLSKPIFDELIMRNPSITLTLTHLLTQRLKEANIARKESEKFYEQKFMPHGSLQETNVIELLKYAEDNSLSGNILFENNDQKAVLSYKKGQLYKLEFAELEEDEAMDVIIEWNTGSYRIEPSIFKPSATNIEQEISLTDESEGILTINNYLEEKFLEFIHFAGAKITQRALNRAYHNFESYFDNIKEIKIEVIPELDINLSAVSEWTEKHTLLLAILIRDVVSAIERDVVGIMFWTPRSNTSQINHFLEDKQFFDLFDQSYDLIRS